MKRICILGATGSIGQSTLSVIAQNSERYSVFALSAHRNIDMLFQQCCDFLPAIAVVAEQGDAETLQSRLKDAGCKTEVAFGEQALADIASHPEVDAVMAAIVGAAGLLPTLAAVEAGKCVMLANKEALVMSGALFTDKVAEHGAQLLPIDSEHNAIFQCLPEPCTSLANAGVEKILLTGSGGPFRTRDPETLHAVTPDEACAHPNWSMGRKISVDSATMMNKGLEFIEACWLFNARKQDIDVVVHPQSIIHSMVQYKDGSVLAQMGQPDMCTPIAHCLAWPERISAGVAPLDFYTLADLSFEAPNYARFPCLKLAMDAVEAGGDYAVALNAANEVAVDRFLSEQLRYTDIASVITGVLENWQSNEPASIAAVIDADKRARQYAEQAARQLSIG